ncbi:MAG: hypothetical protein JWO31_2055 [Phycisphaerales bacterium]|nr:hypothetical protein [Phycisphaerales bacterium]
MWRGTNRARWDVRVGYAGPTAVRLTLSRDAGRSRLKVLPAGRPPLGYLLPAPLFEPGVPAFDALGAVTVTRFGVGSGGWQPVLPATRSGAAAATRPADPASPVTAARPAGRGPGGRRVGPFHGRVSFHRRMTRSARPCS